MRRLFLFALLLLLIGARAHAQVFTGAGDAANPGLILNATGTANPYPYRIAVSGLSGNITGLTVTFNNLTSNAPSDLDFLLVNPNGTKSTALLFGGGDQTPVNNLTLVFSDNAPTMAPTNAPLTSGTYQPTNNAQGDVLDAPAPQGTYGSQLAAFNGAAQNGDYLLYVQSFNPAGEGVNGTLDSASLSFTTDAPVPEPSSGWLLLGMLPLALVRWRRRTA